MSEVVDVKTTKDISKWNNHVCIVTDAFSVVVRVHLRTTEFQIINFFDNVSFVISMHFNFAWLN